MRKLLLSIAALALLAACSTAKLADTPVDLATLQKSAYAARATYVGLLEVAVNITDLPRCERSKPPCVTQPVVNQIRAVQKTAGDATKTAETAVRAMDANPTVLALTVNAATQSVAVFQRTIDANRGGK